MFDFIPARIVLAVTAFFGFQCLYLIRYNLSVTSVAMINDISGNNSDNRSKIYDKFNETLDTRVNWDQQTRGIVLGAFFYGYACTQIIGGRLAEIYGGRIVFGTAITVPGVLTLFLPIASRSHYIWACALRVFQGFFQGMSFPSMHCLLTKWIPPWERSRYVGIIYLASTLSIVITSPLCAAIIAALSWEYAFYITGVIPIIWGFFWFSLVHNEPRLHPRISTEERKYIDDSCKVESILLQNKKVPWKKIWTNLPFLSILICDFGNSFGLSFLFSQLPNFLDTTFHLSIVESGFLSSAPFFFRYIGAVCFGCVVDKLIFHSKMTVTNARKYFSTIAMFGPGILMLIIPFVKTVEWTFGLLCLLLFLNGALAGSQLVNATDLSPNYSGTLFGISNTFASISSLISSIVIGAILQHGEVIDQWKWAFWLCVPFYMISEIIYMIYLSGDIQKFDSQRERQIGIKN